MKPLTLLKIPQILGAGLAANVFISIAAQFKALSGAFWPAYVALIFAFLLNLKDFFDDMKSYEVSEMEGFSLFPTITYRVLSYLCIAWSVSLIPDFNAAFFAISIYFVVFLCWASNSIWRRKNLKSKTPENLERLRRRRGWIVIHGVSAICSFGLSKTSSEIYMSLLLIILFSMFALDAIDSESFSSKINETL